MRKVSKVKVRTNLKKEINYAYDQTLLESLFTIRSTEGLPVIEGLKILQQSKATSISLTLDKPYHFFYARKKGHNFNITLRRKGKEVEFTLPKEKLDNY